MQRQEFILGDQINEEGTTRLEVALVASRGTTSFELRLLGWGRGIDWYVQKSLQLDRRQIKALKHILGRGEGRMASATPKLQMMRRADQQRWNTSQTQRDARCA